MELEHNPMPGPVADATMGDGHESYRLVVQSAPIGIVSVDALGRFLYANRAFREMLGYGEDELRELAFRDLTAPEDVAESLRGLADLREGRTDRFQQEKRYRRRDGSLVWAHVTVAALRDAGGALRATVTMTEDITVRRQAEEALRASEARYRAVVDTLPEVLFEIDRAGHWVFLNPAWTTLTGRSVEASVGTAAADYLHPEDRAGEGERISAVLDGQREGYLAEARYLTADGTVRWVEARGRATRDAAGHIVGLGGTLADITERKALERQLAHQAFHDALTGLANLALLRERLDHALAGTRRRPGTVAALLLDLDGFKRVNDTLGHAVGDALLVAVAGRLAAATRAGDTVARLGGDEFIVVLEHLGVPTAEAEAEAAAARLLAELARPIVIDGREFFVAASIGVALAGPGTPDGAAMLRRADVAMYAAKRGGKGRYVRYDPAMDALDAARLVLEGELHRAVERSEFEVHYQPTVELKTGRITGVEALLRWRHPARGLLPPVEFISLAEETGLIVPIGTWVLGEACRQAAIWSAHYPADPPLTMAVNLSARQLQRPEVVSEVAGALAAAGLPPGRLMLEITESLLVVNAEATIKRLWALKELGVRLAVDDFGTGYSSLSYLQRFPIDVLKIDRAFVSAQGGGPEGTALARAIVEMGLSLGLTTVAEGIEEAGQATALQAQGCELGQGYLYWHPLPAGELDALLAERTAAAVSTAAEPAAAA